MGLALGSAPRRGRSRARPGEPLEAGRPGADTGADTGAATDASSSTCSGVRLRARPCPARPASAPASRARRHSTMWEVYRPSRRSNAPLSPGSVSRSYSARIASLYSGLNLRRRGRAGSWSAMSPSWDATAAVVMLMVDMLLSRPERDKGLRQVSHVRLTDRGNRPRPPGQCTDDQSALIWPRVTPAYFAAWWPEPGRLLPLRRW